MSSLEIDANDEVCSEMMGSAYSAPSRNISRYSQASGVAALMRLMTSRTAAMPRSPAVISRLGPTRG